MDGFVVFKCLFAFVWFQQQTIHRNIVRLFTLSLALSLSLSLSLSVHGTHYYSIWKHVFSDIFVVFKQTLVEDLDVYIALGIESNVTLFLFQAIQNLKEILCQHYMHSDV